MFLSELTQEVAALRGVGPALSAKLERLGVRTVADLLLLLPRQYQDRTKVSTLAEALSMDKAFVVVTVDAVSSFGRGWAKTPKAKVTDGTATAHLVCFGRRYLTGTLKPGRKLNVWGTFRLKAGEIQCSDFELEPSGGSTGRSPCESGGEKSSDFGRILPVYPLTEGLTQGAVRRAVRQALASADRTIEDELPESLARSRDLLHMQDALRGIHLPENLGKPAACRRTLAYGELFHFQVAVQRRRLVLSARREAKRRQDPGLRDRLVASLPFCLTADQETVAAEIAKDLCSPAPMARLLQGDVGCGKTLVALLSALMVIPSGEQAAFAAPTELLARQHAENAARMLAPLGVRTALLCGSTPGDSRAEILAALQRGEIDILFGTHALFSEDVSFRRLGLVIVDEQHKFGVLQRMAMLRKGESPDLLLMTATPIPRTLALTAFGDLDVSTIRQMPAGRRQIVTHLAREGNEEKVYERVRQEIDAGRQAYFVYPLIGESDALEVKDAESAFRDLSERVYPDLRLALIHSRLPEAEKQRAMAQFVAGEIQILVATSVVEVGVDVANAACMVVEHAERFGLSTLHQLRGRVGRGAAQSYAFLVYGRSLTREGIERLKIMKETNDGFMIAERDMALRGPGELLGAKQSGFLNFRIADLSADSSLLLQARDDARSLLAEDPGFLSPDNRVLARLAAQAPPFADLFADGG